MPAFSHMRCSHGRRLSLSLSAQATVKESVSHMAVDKASVVSTAEDEVNVTPLANVKAMEAPGMVVSERNKS